MTQHAPRTAPAAVPDPDLVAAVRAAVDARFPQTLQTLKDLVAIPGMAWDSADRSVLERSAETVAGLLRETGLEDVEIAVEDREDGQPGGPADSGLERVTLLDFHRGPGERHHSRTPCRNRLVGGGAGAGASLCPAGQQGHGGGGAGAHPGAVHPRLSRARPSAELR